MLDAVVLPSPYAYAFGGFVELITVVWWAGGGVIASLGESFGKKAVAVGAEELPEDMSGRCLFGGGLIAGDAIGALSLGVYGLMRTIL